MDVKPTCSPSNLRPLCILPTEAKIIAIMLRARLMPFVSTYLKEVPQYAYVPHRNSTHAIAFVLEHCADVRARLAGFADNLHKKREQQRSGSPAEQFGAFQIALDLSQAFDLLDRSHVEAALVDANAPAELIAAIMCVLSNTAYVFQVGQHSQTLPTQNGIRQGCPLSPLLWSFASGYIYRRLAEALPDSVLRNLTLFADDHHVSFQCNTVSGMYQASTHAGALLDCLKSHNLKVNPDKSVVLLEVRGAEMKRALKRHVQKTKNGRRLMLPSKTGMRVGIPMQSSTKYLGIFISYRNFEDCTVKHNIGKAKARYTQLRHLLNGKIAPILYYGLPVVGLTEQGAYLLHVAVVKQIRAFSASPVHLTREPTLELFRRLHIRDPYPS